MRAIGMTGVPCASVSEIESILRFSRFCKATVKWSHPMKEPEALLASLLAFARTAGEPPVLFYQGDIDTLFISRFRDRLAPHFRFVIPDADLVEALIDKTRFHALANRLSLPTPATTTLTPDSMPTRDLPITFPALVKPVVRQLAVWQPLAGHAKALQVDSFDVLVDIWRRASASGTPLIVQQLIPGDETHIESYHAYVDARGQVVAAFTGRKVRTYPVQYGQSSALELTAEEDVARMGEELIRRMGLRGVAKLDFKRDRDGRLYLLEVNPRFNLWHHLGAMSGVNLPALVYADLTGGQRPAIGNGVPGLGWSRPREDFRAVRAAGAPLAVWFSWMVNARARSGLSADDPLLILGWVLRRSFRGRNRDHTGIPAEPGGGIAPAGGL